MKNKNQKILKALKASFLIVICLQMAASFALASWPSSALAIAVDPATLKFEPQIRIPGSSLDAASVDVAAYDPKTGKMNSDLIGRYIQAFYNYGMAAAGILAAIVLMAGGVLWLTSGGDSGKVGQAKELIIGSIIGTIILFSSWIILNTVNPELLNFKTIDIPAINKASFKDNGIINDLKDLPADTKYGWVCMNKANQQCVDTNPPTINLDINICDTGQPSNVKPINCPFGLLWCCGKSESTIQQGNIVCQGKSDFTECKVNQTAIDMICLQEKCVSKSGASICCQCGQGCVAGICVWVTCRNDLTVNDCKAWCTNNWVGAGYNAYYGGSEKYTCAGGAMSYCRTK
ncbi:MAG: hypothetical protein NTY31_00500 [Candidatus Falkowbacteria bacterium]|nr:hypothetical protein [Candidatus Falkowbacteria bacterium]